MLGACNQPVLAKPAVGEVDLRGAGAVREMRLMMVSMESLSSPWTECPRDQRECRPSSPYGGLDSPV